MTSRFTTSSILLALAFVGISLGGVFFYERFDAWLGWDWVAIAWATLSTAALWMPAVFLAYSIGRRALTWKIVLVFAVVEIATAAAMYWRSEIELLMKSLSSD